MSYLVRYVPLLLLFMASQEPQAQDLLVTKKSWDGSTFSYPTNGTAQMTAGRIILIENEQTPDHCHPVPVFGYMLSGTIEVKTAQGKSTTFTEGDALTEVMTITHNGRAIGGDAEILAFYAGSTELPNTVIADGGDSAKIHCLP